MHSAVETQMSKETKKQFGEVMKKLNAKVVCHNLAHDMFALCRELQKRGLNSPSTETQIHFYSKSCLKQDLLLHIRWVECQDHPAMADGLLQQSDIRPVPRSFFSAALSK